MQTPVPVERFALIGAAGYVAPRHLKAIRDTGNSLVAAMDPHDSVGVLDSYFPDAHFFTEFERFDRHIDKLRRQPGQEVGYVSVCSPNYLHDAHMRFALRSGADAVCEKPLVLNPWNLDGLETLEKETGRKVHSLLLLRQHAAIAALKAEIEAGSPDRKYEVELTYITPRGRWYFASWKGDVQKSGGISTNIGIHFYDLLHYLFGQEQLSELHYKSSHRESGYIEYERARVKWFLSVDAADLQAASAAAAEQGSCRMISLNGKPIDFTEGLTGLHTAAYQALLAGRGWGIADSRPAIETVCRLRSMTILGHGKDRHPLLQKLHG